MSIGVVFGERDFRAGWAQPAPQAWTLERMAWSAMGGPDVAWISATAPVGPPDRWRDLLRCPVELFSAGGERCWWGYVSTVSLESAGGALRMSLDEMRNSVVCRYRVFGGQERVERIRDEACVALYGEKETLLDLGESSPLRAAAAARAVLQRWSGARSAWERAKGTLTGSLRVRLGLRGWWHTLGWRLFLASGEGSAAVDVDWNANAEIGVGSSSALARCAQALVDGHNDYPGWRPLELEVRARRVGSPTDTLQVSFYRADAAGVPVGLALDTAAVPTGPELQDVRVSLSGAAQVVPADPFALVFSRTGGLNATHYYRVGLREPGGAYACLSWNGTYWSERVPHACALVRAVGGADTTELAMYYASPLRGGQFLSRVLAEAHSGVDSAAQDGRARTCRRELEDMLRAGSAGGLPLLAEVDARRVLRVWPAVEGDAEWHIGADGSLRPAWGGASAGPGQAGRVPGHWARYDAFPGAPPALVQGCAWENGRLVVTSVPGRGWPR